MCIHMSTCVYACDKVCVYLSREIFISIIFFRVQVIPPSAYVYVGMCIHPYTCRHTCMCVYIYDDVDSFQQSIWTFYCQ